MTERGQRKQSGEPSNLSVGPRLRHRQCRRGRANHWAGLVGEGTHGKGAGFLDPREAIGVRGGGDEVRTDLCIDLLTNT